jgi:hypothetical protein
VLYPRHLDPLVREALSDSPAVLVNGPRQCGKTTLVKHYEGEMAYFTLDDPGLLSAVKADPLGFVKQIDRAIIDEVQRAPELLVALKLAIDQDRRPGRFLLSGSADLMALAQISDSLAGRIEIHTLLPLSHAELCRRPSDFLKRAYDQSWTLGPISRNESVDIENQILSGGYPEMLKRANTARRQAWTRTYIKTLIERDIKEIIEIEHHIKVPQLLNITAQLSGQLVNMSHIGGLVGLSSKTVDKYLGVLEKIFLVRRLPAWSVNELSRLIKTPKLHFIDAGLQSTLTRLNSKLLLTDRRRLGATLETWVYSELLKILSIETDAWFLSHFRDKDQNEVDFVLESASREIIGIKVKAASSVIKKDFTGLRKLREIAGTRFITGIVLYSGEYVLPFGEGLWAVPLYMI